MFTTIFTSTVSSRNQIDNVYPVLNSWLQYQDMAGLKKHGFFISYLSKERVFVFNFFIVRNTNLSDEEREKVWAILESQNLCILKETVHPDPAT